MIYLLIMNLWLALAPAIVPVAPKANDVPWPTCGQEHPRPQPPNCPSPE